MKRMVTLLLLMACVRSLAACGNGRGDDEPVGRFHAIADIIQSKTEGEVFLSKPL